MNQQHLIRVQARTFQSPGDARTVTIYAIVRGVLALHRQIVTTAAGYPSPIGDGWTITHVPTGLSIKQLDSCRVARRALRLLAALDFWPTVTSGGLVDSQREAARAAIARAFDRE